MKRAALSPAGRPRAAVGLHAFQVDPQLHGEAARSGGFQQAQFGQAEAFGQAQLRLHQINAGDTECPNRPLWRPGALQYLWRLHYLHKDRP
ncbi:hypothetical protein [Metapseudomonas sp. CR1201]|jgi:hypothetical protein